MTKFMRALGRAAMAAAFLCLAHGRPAYASDARSISIILTGQSLMKSDFRTYAPETVATMRPLLAGDVVFTNYETTVGEEGGPLDELHPDHGSYAPPASLDALQDLGFNLLALSNNHSYDLGETGILNTLRHVRQRRIAHAGIGNTVDEAAAPGYFETPNGTVALVSLASGLIHRAEAAATATTPGLNQLHLDAPVPGISVGFPRPDDAQRILRNIREASARADIVIVYHHNHIYDLDFVRMIGENRPERFSPPAWVRSWSRAMVDAGADLVVFHGAPFIQGLELYQGKPIFFNLGNFIFELPQKHDHLFSEEAWRSVIARAEFQDGTLTGVSFTPIAMDFAGVPSAMAGLPEGATRGLPAPASPTVAATVLRELAQRSAKMGTDIRIEGSRAVLVLPDQTAAQ